MNTYSAITQFQGRLEREKVPLQTIMFVWSGVSGTGLKVFWERRALGKKLKRELLKFVKLPHLPCHKYFSGLQHADTHCQRAKHKDLFPNTVDPGVAYSQASRNPRGRVNEWCCLGLRKLCVLKTWEQPLFLHRNMPSFISWKLQLPWFFVFPFFARIMMVLLNATIRKITRWVWG